MLPLNAKLKSLIAKLWDRFWSGGISNPLSAIEQITYLLFMKRLDDLDIKRQQDAKFTGDTYKSRFEGKYYAPHDTDKKHPIPKKTLRWSHFKQMPAQQMLAHVQQNVFPFIKTLNGDGTAFARHMANAVFIIPNGNLLHGAIQIIEDIFVEMERDASEQGHLFQDIQGDVYEMLLNEIASAGKNGQFRTPRHIIKLVSELVRPQLGHRICDPACGTAGFLLDAYQYIITQLALKKPNKNARTITPDEDGFLRTSVAATLTSKVKDILDQNLYGYDFDPTMVRLALMNLMMHGIDDPHVDYQDTLGKNFDEEEAYDIVMANPPFTGSIDKSNLNETFTLETTKTELLFVERIFKLLKIDGTAGIIIPQGVLTNSTKAFVEARRMLVENAELKAVIALPGGVFKPYAGVATAILLFTRGGKTKRTWFYRVDNDGLTLDDKRNRIEGTQLPDVVTRWHTGKPEDTSNRKENHFYVSAADLREKNYDLSFNRYSEVEHTEIEYDPPQKILKAIKEMEAKIQKGIEELEDILG